jgi:LysM repeat protein
MKKATTIFFLMTFIICAFAQQSRVDYIMKYQGLAISEMNRSGIPASIKLAQACLESGDGLSTLSTESNNHFGIKCRPEWMGEKVYFDDDERNECFRKYNTVEESFIDHTEFLVQNPRYRFLFDLGSTNYKGWANGLKEAGYATDRAYDSKLIKIIEDFELNKLDVNIPLDQIALLEKVKVKGRWGSSGTGNTIINAWNIHEVTLRNGIKSVVAMEGDSYELIGQEFGLKNWELCRFNDQPKGYMPQTNEVVYIKSKKYRSSKSKTFHKAEGDDTMHYISQRYGIKLKPLLRRNNMRPGDQPQEGQVIWLRKRMKSGN